MPLILMGLAPVTRFSSLILLQLFKAKMKSETLTWPWGDEDYRAILERQPAENRKVLFLKLLPRNNGKAKAA